MSVLFAGVKTDFFEFLALSPGYWVAPTVGVEAGYCDGGLELRDGGPRQRLNLKSDPVGVMWTHMKIARPGYQSDIRMDGYFMGWHDGAGNLLARADVSNGDWRVQVFGDTTVSGSLAGQDTTTSITASQWDFELNVTATDITFTWYVNRIAISSATVANATAGNGPCRSITWDMSTAMFSTTYAGRWRMSELIITDNDEDPSEWRLAHLPLSASGTYNQWTGSYLNADDNDDATTLFTDQVGQRSSWALGSLDPAVLQDGQVIAAVVHVTSGSGTDNNYLDVASSLRMGGVDYDGAFQKITDANTCCEVWDVNPATGVSWEFSDITSLEVGIVSSGT